MSETVDALGYKADVPSRAKDSINEKVQGVRGRLTGVGSQVSEATPGTEDVKRAGQQAVGVVHENPLGLAIGAAAVGFLAGMLIPSSRIEDERLGPVADQVKQQVQETGEEALERGKQVVQDTVQTATDSAKQVAQDAVQTATDSAKQVAADARESAQHQAEELKSSAQENAQEITNSAGA
ncbi:MAG TPA: hypothetical protein VLP43_02690 [Solirubrobacteraceae bacterium]|nr:hypothetical protein [Solirubrobacteraceae bacterium]